jgi:hypothetical protein
MDEMFALLKDKSAMTDILLAIVIVIGLGQIWVGRIILRNMTKERQNIASIIEILPQPVILNNRYLKSYLCKTSNDFNRLTKLALKVGL